eukprot:289792_1
MKQMVVYFSKVICFWAFMRLTTLQGTALDYPGQVLMECKESVASVKSQNWVLTRHQKIIKADSRTATISCEEGFYLLMYTYHPKTRIDYLQKLTQFDLHCRNNNWIYTDYWRTKSRERVYPYRLNYNIPFCLPEPCKPINRRWLIRNRSIQIIRFDLQTNTLRYEIVCRYPLAFVIGDGNWLKEDFMFVNCDEKVGWMYDEPYSKPFPPDANDSEVPQCKPMNLPTQPLTLSKPREFCLTLPSSKFKSVGLRAGTQCVSSRGHSQVRETTECLIRALPGFYLVKRKTLKKVAGNMIKIICNCDIRPCDWRLKALGSLKLQNWDPDNPVYIGVAEHSGLWCWIVTILAVLVTFVFVLIWFFKSEDGEVSNLNPYDFHITHRDASRNNRGRGSFRSGSERTNIASKVIFGLILAAVTKIVLDAFVL